MKKKRVIRPLKFKLDAYRFYSQGGMSSTAAFERAAIENATTLSGCMTHYASSYMSDDVKNFLRKKIVSKDLEVIEYFQQHGLSLF